jgi:outer membrane protein TolC
MTRTALEQAEENLRVSSDNFEVGMGLLTDLLEAQTHWQSARSEQIDARADLRLKETAWLKALGQLK